MKIKEQGEEVEFVNKFIIFMVILWRKLVKREIGFTDVVIIIITILSLTILRLTDIPSIGMLLWRFVFLFPLMCILALINNNHEKYNERFRYMFDIMTSSLPIDDKAKAIKSELKKITSLWGRYNKAYKQIVEGDTSLLTKTTQVWSLGMRIVKGHITVPQGIYIMLSLFYNIVISSNLLQIAKPYDIMINAIFIVILRFWGAEYAGLGELINDFLKALAPDKSDLEKEQAFIELGDKMKDGCYASFILTEKCDVIEVKQGVKTKADGSLMSKEEIDLEDAKELSKSLGEAKAKLNGQIEEATKKEE